MRRIKATELAKTLGVSRQHVYHIEAGTRNMSVDRLQKVARALHTDTDYLLSGPAA